MSLARSRLVARLGPRATELIGDRHEIKGVLVFGRRLIPVVAALALAFTSIGFSATPAEAAKWVDGWYTFYGKQTMTQTFNERTPARSRVVLKLQKKRGTQVCRARVIIRKGGAVSSSQQLYKYSRQQWSWYSTVIDWPNRVRKTAVTVKTNGNCQYRVWIQ